MTQQESKQEAKSTNQKATPKDQQESKQEAKPGQFLLNGKLVDFNGKPVEK